MVECHVITLDRTVDNFYKQKPHLMNSGLIPKVFFGTDAKKGDHTKHDELLTPVCKNFCPDGLIGCGLSHILLAKKLFKQGTQLALILEDDAYPVHSDMNQEIQKVISETPRDWDIIKLHCDFCTDNDSDPIGGSAAAYLINYSGLEKIKDMKLDWHFDIQILLDPSLHVYKSKENLFWADETTSDNRDSSSTFIGKLFNFNKTGQKTTDHMMSYKLFKVFGYEVSGWNLIIIIILLHYFKHVWQKNSFKV